MLTTRAILGHEGLHTQDHRYINAMRSLCPQQPVSPRHRTRRAGVVGLGAFPGRWKRKLNTVLGFPALSSRPIQGILIESDGVIMDLHIDGHRVAFNK